MKTRQAIRLKGALTLTATAMALCLLAAPAVAQKALPATLNEFCPTGSGAGQCNIPRGIAVDPASGNVYVADQSNRRIIEFTAWGEFVRAWGWGVLDGSPELQTCMTACLASVAGGEVGQFNGTQGLAVDAEGSVYVVDRNNRRVQKFDVSGPTVAFELMFGGNVNKTQVEEPGSSEAQKNLCTATSGDVCQEATQGAGNGQFGTWVVGSYLAVSPNGETIYVGDQNRIQEFDTGGAYLGDLPDPDGLLAANTVQSLVADPGSGDLYVARNGKEDVLRLDPLSGAKSCPGLSVERPSAIAVSGSGAVYVVSALRVGSPSTPLKLVEFDSACAETERFAAEEAGFTDSTGIAVSSPPTCGLSDDDLFVANSVASNSFIGLYGPPPDPDVCPQPVVPPEIEDQYAVSVGSSGATVRAEIDPRFWPDTRYFVQYGTGKCSEGGCAEQPLAPGSLLTEEVVKAPIATAGVLLSGLESDTTYHYRFVAASGGGGPVFGDEETFTTFPPPLSPNAKCPNQAFRTGLSAPLPDCRAYELVSPLDKNNGDIATDEVFNFDAGNFQMAATDGGKVTYSAFTPFGSPGGAPLFSQFLSARDPKAGWATHSISPPRTSVPFYPALSHGNLTQFKAFSEDLCHGWFVQDTDLALTPGAPPGVPSIYRRDEASCGEGGYELTTPVVPPGFEPFETNEGAPNSVYFPEVQGVSADSRHILLRADAVLTPNACKTVLGTEQAKGIFQLYLHTEGEEEMRLVSVLPNGKAACVHSSAGTAQGVFGQFREDSVHHALADDASRVFWSESRNPNNKLPPFGGGQADQAGPLYVRLNPLGPQSAGGKCSTAAAGEACTIEISKAADARFRGADPAGEAAIYTAGGGLFEFDVQGEESRTIAASGVLGVMGMSEDAGRVFFVSTTALTEGEENEAGETALGGALNLYLSERDGGTFELSFVARLSGTDAENQVSHFAEPSAIAPLPDRRLARVSADGLHAAFASTAPLTGYDNTDAASGKADSEVFLYDAVPGGGAGHLACVSCNPTGSRPHGGIVGNYHVAARLPGWEYQLYPSRALAEDGNHIFFESYDALVLRDTNGKRDVYEWQRAANEKGCEEAGAELYGEDSGGCLSLISSGKSAANSEFIDASASGSDVFFITAASLLPHDFGLMDVYDAREGGGFAPPEEPEPPCEGEACQPAPAPPEPTTPASLSFEGRGNVVSGPPRRRCGKGKRRVVRAGKARCVKKRAKRKQRR